MLSTKDSFLPAPSHAELDPESPLHDIERVFDRFIEAGEEEIKRMIDPWL